VKRWAAAIAVALYVIGAAIVSAQSAPPTKEMYECVNHTHVWDKAQCPEFKSAGPASFPGGGGGGRGGLLGLVHDLTGGLL